MNALVRLNFAHLDQHEQSVAPAVRLVYRDGPGAAGRWPADSPWRGHGTFDLVAR